MRNNLGLSLHQAIGRQFEEFVRDLLAFSFGLDVQDINNWNASFDLEVNGKCIEVKAAYPTKRTVNGKQHNRWQFNLSSKVDETTSYYVVLVAIDENETEYIYCVPGDKVAGPTIQLTSHPNKYSGKYAQYKDNFDGLISFLGE